VSLMSDNGGQPTAQAFMAACSMLGIHQAFTSDNNPKGNADTERVMRTLKEEGLWLQEWASPFELVRALATWIDTYNNHYLHSARGYRTPRRVEMEDHNSHRPPFVAA
jgi:putative transposase